MNQNMYNNKINNPIPAYLDKDNTFIQEDNRINPLVYMHVTENKSPREWLRDVKFAENAYLTPEMQITGDGAKNYQKALDKVSNFKTKVKPMSQGDYQREMYFNKFDTSEVDRLIYLNNALDTAWNNKKGTFKNDRQYNKAYNKYVEQKNTIDNNLKNINAAADKIISNEKWMDEFNRLGHVWNTQVFPTLIGTTMLAGYSSPWSASAAPPTASAATAASHTIRNIALEQLRRAARDPRTYLSILGGMAADEGVRWLSDGNYEGVSDYVYNKSGLKNLAEGTWAEDLAKTVANMVNPAYYLPYGKIANSTGSLIDDGIYALQKNGFFAPDGGIPANALGMNLFRLKNKSPEIYPLKGYDAQANGSQHPYKWMTPTEYSVAVQPGTKVDPKIFKYPKIRVNQATGEVDFANSKAQLKSRKINTNNPFVSKVKLKSPNNTSVIPVTEAVEKKWMTPEEYVQKFNVMDKRISKYPRLLVDNQGNIDYYNTKLLSKLDNPETATKWYKKFWPWGVTLGTASVGYGIYSSLNNESNVQKPESDGEVSYSKMVDAAVEQPTSTSNNYNQSNTKYYDSKDLDF